MTRILVDLLTLLILLVIQLSFIQSLPYPLDRTPVLLVWTIYAYQYKGHARTLWFLPAYGLVLDVLELSYAPAPWLPWSAAALAVYALGRHLFTNRSFYSMAMMALAAFATLTAVQLPLVGLFGMVRSQPVAWIDIALSQCWPAALAAALLLFVAPWLRGVKRGA